MGRSERFIRRFSQTPDSTADGSSVESVTLQFEDREAAVDFLIRTAGNLIAERESLTRQGRWNIVRDDLGTVVDRHNTDASPTISLQLDYLLSKVARDESHVEPSGVALIEGQDLRRLSLR